jgi:AcrR family transcriptional regulator
VQAGALYNYTPDKQTLLFNLLCTHMEELLDASADDTTLAPIDRLRDFVEFHIRFHADRPEEVFISYMELRNLTPENFSTVEALRRRYEDRLEGILQSGADTGDFAIADTKIATLAVIAMLTGVNTWFRAGGRLSLDQVIAQYWDMVRKSVVSGQGSTAHAPLI